MNPALVVFLCALLSALLMIVGGLGPWVDILGVVSVSGTSGDGWFPIVGGLVAGGLVVIRQVTGSASRWYAIVALVMAVVGVLVTIVDLADIEGMAEGESLFEGAASAAWGIYLALIASASLLAASIVALVVRAPTPAGYAGGPAQAAAGYAPAPVAGVAPAADWYPDPKGERRLRYWDGAAWTHHTAD